MAKNQNRETGYKSAPTPGGNFIKLGVGMFVEGIMKQASMEVESRKVKGKNQEKDRYHFGLELLNDTELLVGKVGKEQKKMFEAGTVVLLPDHGFLTTTFCRTACELAGVPFDKEKDTDLKPLLGVQFLVLRLEDGEISSGPFAGKASALYDVKYKEAVPA